MVRQKPGASCVRGQEMWPIAADRAKAVMSHMGRLSPSEKERDQILMGAAGLALAAAVSGTTSVPRTLVGRAIVRRLEASRSVQNGRVNNLQRPFDTTECGGTSDLTGDYGEGSSKRDHFTQTALDSIVGNSDTDLYA
jgi:hypothetical protein